jgi:hypothetical protein
MRTHELSEANTSDPGWPQDRFHEVIAALLPLLLGGELLLWVVLVPVGLRGDADFAMFYTAGHMVRVGQSRQLYNYDVETRFQNQLVSKTPAPYTHLPYEALLFAPISLLPYRAAYWSFLLANLSLAIFGLLLMPTTGLGWSSAVILASFFPVSAAVADGQDSIMLLTIACGAWLLFSKKQESLAGGLLALGLFRFQIVLPIVGLMFLWKRWRFLAGFVPCAASVVAFSGWLAGFDQLRVYGSHVLSLGAISGQETGYSLSASQSQRMVSLRALFTNILPSGQLAQIITLLASIALLVWVASRGRTLGRKHQFALAIAFSVLVSYHLFVYDLAILLMPMVAALELTRDTQSRAAQAAILIPLLTVPVGILWRPFLLALPLLAFLFAITCAFRMHSEQAGEELVKGGNYAALDGVPS